MNLLKKIFPILSWLPQYKRSMLSGDISAGITVGIVLIPQGMAYALIAGLPPVYGLYAAMLPQAIYAIFGTSRQLAVAPIATDSLLVASGVALIATEGTETYIAYAIILAFLMGIFQLIFGLLRMGFITNLLSKPVLSGFISAVAITIGLSQLKHLLGVDIAKNNRLYLFVPEVVKSLNQIHWLTFFIGAIGIAFIFILKKATKKIPGSVAVVALSILAVFLFNLDKQGLKIIGEIPSGLPSFGVPDFSLDKWTELIPLAFTLAVIAFVEGFSVAKSLEAKRRNYKVLPNQELIALGMSNIVGSFFQSYSVTGGFSRSAINESSGANTSLSSMISAVVVASILLFFTPVFQLLPKATLASVIMAGVIGLIDWKYAKTLWKEDKIAFALLLVVFLVTLNFSMIPGILTGVVLSILILLYRSAYPHIAILGRLEEYSEFRNVNRFENLQVWDNILILRLDASLSFINIQYFKSYIEKLINEQPQIDAIILDASPISHIDATAVYGLRDLVKNLQEKQVKLIVSEVIGPVRDIFHKTNLIELIGEENMFLDLEGAIKYATNSELQEDTFKHYALQSNYKQNIK